jgi:outer membrane protein assembly factor BamB
VKFASNGTKLWNVSWGVTYDDRGYGITVNPNGYLYCIGYTYSLAKGKDFALVKFNSTTGRQLWNSTWGGLGEEVGKGVATDNFGYIHCCGETSSWGAGMRDFALVTFAAPSGIKVCNTTWGSTRADTGAGIAVDLTNNIYCIGETMGGGTNERNKSLLSFFL